MPAPAATAPWDWIVALTFITSFFAAFGNGANDVANSFATSVAARTLKMWQVGILAMIFEFIGAFALGSRVTATIKNGIIDPGPFFGSPAVFMLVMACAELANATWLMTATHLSMPVSTTQTIVGSLVGAGLAVETRVQWGWTSGSVSQIAASWVIAPAISAALAALLFGTIKHGILSRGDKAFHAAMLAIPFYLAFTAAMLALFIVIEAPTAPSLEEFGAGPAVGIILGVFFGVLAIGYIFFRPYFHRRLVLKDARISWYHLPLGPLLYRDNPPLYWPSKKESSVISYYEDAYGNVTAGTMDSEEKRRAAAEVGNPAPTSAPTTNVDTKTVPDDKRTGSPDRSSERGSTTNTLFCERFEDVTPERAQQMVADIEKDASAMPQTKTKAHVKPYDRFIGPVKDLHFWDIRKWWGYIKFILLRGVTTDVITHDSALLRSIHARAHRYDDRIEHLWTYCQVASAILSCISHGANDVANAIGPLAAVYQTWQAGEVATETPVPIWILAFAGVTLGLGFWFFGYNIMRAVGNRITQLSPIRGYAIELGSAITVLMASRLGLPVSTTQCLVGASMGVALMNYDLRAVNWRQMAFIAFSWACTLPGAAIISAIITLMAVNTPRWDMPSP